MTSDVDIRESTPGNTAAIVELYPQAFPDEDLVPLVRDLLPDTVNVLSLVATIDSKIVGHVVFTNCSVEGTAVNASLLGPLAVAPDRQRQGVGTAIVRAGLQQLAEAGVSLVCVLGDPAYYSRLGFAPETAVEPPYPLPAEWASAWQSRYLGETMTPCAGKLTVPPPWQQPALWAP